MLRWRWPGMNGNDQRSRVHTIHIGRVVKRTSRGDTKGKKDPTDKQWLLQSCSNYAVCVCVHLYSVYHWWTVHQLYPFYYLKSNEIIMGDSRGTMTGQYIWTHMAWHGRYASMALCCIWRGREENVTVAVRGTDSGISCHYQVNFHQPVEKVKSGQPFPLKESS